MKISTFFDAEHMFLAEGYTFFGEERKFLDEERTRCEYKKA